MNDRPNPRAKHRARALVIDSDAETRGTLARLLARNGYVVKLADAPHRATEALTSFDPHAVFIATVIYAESDIHLLRQLRERRARGLRIYGLVPATPTAAGQLQRDFTALITTPVEAEQLIQLDPPPAPRPRLSIRRRSPDLE